MSALRICQFPERVLTQEAKPVKKITKRVLNFIQDMKTTLVDTTNPKGVGLAAPQVGKSLQIFMIIHEEGKRFVSVEELARTNTVPNNHEVKEELKIFINPKIKLRNELLKFNDPTPMEGCLSIHGWWGNVKRYKVVDIDYVDETGQHHKETYRGMSAVIIQHEYDHLKGKLFIHRIKEQKGSLLKEEGNSIETEEFLKLF